VFPWLLVVSYCEHASLLSYLTDDDVQVSLREKVGLAIGIATGMAHLAANRIIHRDLAARNVLVDSALTAKVADFGLSRSANNEQGEYKSQKGTFPIRWTAPEAIQSLLFNQATDVWSFAITLIELFKNGERPYSGLNNAAVINNVLRGERETQPTTCPDVVYAIMLSCWSENPTDRPQFQELVALLEEVQARHLYAAAF
jgi:serine/threonine protein kinase